MKERYFCPVCGAELERAAWDDGIPSFDICESCGIQFGYTDAAGGSLELRKKIYIAWRKLWENNYNQPLSKKQAEDALTLADEVVLP